MSSYVHHQSPPAPLFAGCPRRPSPRSAPRGRMDLNLFREHQAAFRAEFRPPFPIGPLTWGGVFVKFPFPPRTPPQPRAPSGLTRWGTDAKLCPYFGEFKTEMYHFFYPRLLRAQIYLIGRAKNRPLHVLTPKERPHRGRHRLQDHEICNGSTPSQRR